MNRILALLFVLFAFAGVARADEVQPLPPAILSCNESTGTVCNDSQVPVIGHAGDALDYLYFRPSIISTWRLAESPGTTNPRFIGTDGTATADDFMSGVVMASPGGRAAPVSGLLARPHCPANIDKHQYPPFPMSTTTRPPFLT